MAIPKDKQDQAVEIARSCKADEPQGAEKHEQCLKCNRVIIHGEPFIPVVKNKSEKRIYDPHFIGRQASVWAVSQVPVGAICLHCMGCQ